ncbi:MAG: PilZ domain-containing protein [Gemmataceae bacterium]|nr:PilZ domain-containing protein [Gemmataceae bacterium]
MSEQRKHTASADNRRRSRRHSVNRIARVECRKGALGLGRDLVIQALDISQTGLRLVLKEALKVREQAEILLAGGGLPRALKRLATVAWVLPVGGGGYCAGLNFEKPLPYADLQRLARPAN